MRWSNRVTATLCVSSITVDSGAPRRLMPDEPRPHVAIWSPDGARLAVSPYYITPFLWNAQTGQLIRELKGHSFPVNAVSFSPDGAMLAFSIIGASLLDRRGRRHEQAARRDHGVGGRLHAHLHDASPAGHVAAELDGIAHQVVEHLLDAHRVAAVRAKRRRIIRGI